MSEFDFALLPESYETLSAENVAANKQLLRDLWRAAEPQLDVDHGALDALVLNPVATLLEVARSAFHTARKSSSFTALLNDSSDISQRMLDELAKSYRVQRRTGTAASGRIRVFFQEDIYRVIGLSTIFQANGFRFHLKNVETLQLSGDLPSTLPNYQNLKSSKDGSGLFYADMTVYASATGAGANLVQGTELTLYQSSLPYFVRAVALESFSGGENDEDSESLLRRMLLGVSAKVLSSRINMKAALLEKFPEIRDSSVIGAGDPEMTRDKHTIFPGSTGGYADWYVGTTRQLARTSFVIEQPLEHETTSDGQFFYTVLLDDSQVSCLYHVTDIQDEETLEYCEILSRTFHLRDSTGSGSANVPVIHNCEEAAFTAYQVMEVQFVSRMRLSRIRVYALHAPLIREIQDWVLQSNLAPIGTDVLVKGAIPTAIRFSAVIHTPAGESINEIELRSSVSEAINHLPFNGLLAVSRLTALLHQKLPAGSYITRPTLLATTWLPNGEIVISHAEDRLEIDFPPYASNRTTLFYCDPADVTFEIRFTEKNEICG